MPAEHLSRPPALPGAVTGFIDLISHVPGQGWRLAGWARHASSPKTPATVAVLWHGEEVARGPAETFRPDLVIPGEADGRHAFEFLIPDTTAPATSPAAFDLIVLPGHIPLRRAGDQPPAPPVALQGSVDIVGRDRIAGWLRNDDVPDTRLGIIVSVDGALIRRVLANRLRTDLRDTGLGDGRYGFDIPLSPPLSADADHMVTITCAETGESLPGSPFHFAATRRFNETFRQHVRQTLGGLASTAHREQALRFLSSELDRLRQTQGRDDARSLATEQHRNARRPGGAASAATPSRILFIDDRAPDPTRDAGSGALLSHMQAAQALGHNVSFIASVTDPGDAPARELEKLGVTCFRAPTYPGVEMLLRAQSGSFDAIYFHRLSNASRYLALARQYMPGARLISSVADLAHLRIERQATIEGRPELKTLAGQERVREHMAAWSSHAVITHSPVEATLLARAVPTASIHVVPWHIAEKPAPLPFPDRHGIAFIAHYGHAPNPDAAKWLAEDIFPRIRKEIPEAELLLIGSAMPDVIVRMNNQPGIRVLGHVSDLTALLRTVRLTIAPLRFGAGIKSKVLESWAAGIPCVTTPMAVEGLTLPPELSACVASSAEALATLTADLYRHQTKAEIVSQAGLSYVKSHLNKEEVRIRLSRALGLPQNRQTT
ncbi:glycosyltransferase [Acetobacter fallax]|uniref:Glycosyltransferase n=1 Tax=Acetobacter fallax TaxID=1737473 RepID=A0ABX0KDK5_9PROT|nr:glycosyltransferase [Acetobacter fallax]NHO33198.1 glycosyltransferase [Acetobacter fallax]NHO36772.1 glycosyltransferase [Acetobacter fallax]